MQKMINEINRKPDALRLWVTVPKSKWDNVREMLRKLAVHDGRIEQYTETLPRRWWQLKAATRIRIRRVQPQTFNCRCVRVEL
jgi:hypothetical protein